MQQLLDMSKDNMQTEKNISFLQNSDKKKQGDNDLTKSAAPQLRHHSSYLHNF